MCSCDPFIVIDLVSIFLTNFTQSFVHDRIRERRTCLLIILNHFALRIVRHLSSVCSAAFSSVKSLTTKCANEIMLHTFKCNTK